MCYKSAFEIWHGNKLSKLLLNFFQVPIHLQNFIFKIKYTNSQLL